MKKCEHCQKENSVTKKYCISCGKKLFEKPRGAKNSKKGKIIYWLIAFFLTLSSAWRSGNTWNLLEFFGQLFGWWLFYLVLRDGFGCFSNSNGCKKV